MTSPAILRTPAEWLGGLSLALVPGHNVVARALARCVAGVDDGSLVAEFPQLVRHLPHQSLDDVVGSDVVFLIGVVINLAHVEFKLLFVDRVRNDDRRARSLELAGEVRRRGPPSRPSWFQTPTALQPA